MNKPMPLFSDLCQWSSEERFGYFLRDALKRTFKSLPTAARFAEEFNLRNQGREPITQESARKWMRGVSIPHLQRLGVLISWLDLDIHEVLAGCPSKSHPHLHQVSQFGRLTNLRVEELIGLFSKLNCEQQESFLSLVETIPPQPHCQKPESQCPGRAKRRREDYAEAPLSRVA